MPRRSPTWSARWTISPAPCRRSRRSFPTSRRRWCTWRRGRLSTRVAGPGCSPRPALGVSLGGGRLCLDASGQGTSAGTKVITWTCNGQSNQQWTLNADGTVTAAQSGLCLDVSGAATANGSLVQLWTCNGGSNQKWSLI